MRLIDADTLINELDNSHYPGAPYINAGISIAIGKVCDAPTVKPERKKGQWIGRRCSVCESRYPDDVFTWNYCPHCGAYMGGDEG